MPRILGLHIQVHLLLFAFGLLRLIHVCVRMFLFIY